MMRVTVCELPGDWADTAETWSAVAAAMRNEKSDLVLLPEMPFHRWLAGSSRVDPEGWQAAVTAHDRWIERLSEFATPVVIGSRPVIDGHRRYNRGFVWEKASGARNAHAKYYLPDEEGFWEATWYQRGDGRFEFIEVNGIRIGFLICTELWFGARARAYAAQGIHILVCPRATPLASVDKWIAGGRTAAVVSGAFCLSSNFNGPLGNTMAFGGSGWVIEPEAGDVLGLTTRETPILTVTIDPALADNAKRTYPRYVSD
jgi:N-carbamoylputrescine amidase